jgi:hypothetical protein
MVRPVEPETEVRLAFSRAALGIAYERLEAVEGVEAPDVVAVAAAAVEVCVWITGVLDIHQHGESSDLLDAVQWARNEGAHGRLVRAEQATDGVFVLDVSTLDGPDVLGHCRWVERTQLAASATRETKVKRELRRRRAYDVELAGRPVLLTLRAARALVDPAFAEYVALVDGP